MDWGLFFTYLAACGAAAASGALIKPGPWYAALAKPRWTPPDWAFPLVWTSLYLCMSFAAQRVAGLPEAVQAIAFWSVQIALGTLWTPVFFGLKRMRAALWVMAALWISVLATFVSFLMVDLVAGLVLAPYMVWVSIAALLNIQMVRLNPTEAG